MIAPVPEEIAEEYAGKVKIAKLNIDENPVPTDKLGHSYVNAVQDGSVEATKGAISKSQPAF